MSIVSTIQRFGFNYWHYIFFEAINWEHELLRKITIQQIWSDFVCAWFEVSIEKVKRNFIKQRKWNLGEQKFFYLNSLF